MVIVLIPVKGWPTTKDPLTVAELQSNLFFLTSPKHFDQLVPLKYWKQLESKLKINNPVAGDIIVFLWASVILGGKKPLEVDFTSNMEDGSGLAV